MAVGLTVENLLRAKKLASCFRAKGEAVNDKNCCEHHTGNSPADPSGGPAVVKHGVLCYLCIQIHNRLYARKELNKVMEDPVSAHILYECIVYVPADVLEGIVLIDAPGTVVFSPQEQMQFAGVLETEDSIVVRTQRNLQDCKYIKPAIQNSVRGNYANP